VREPEQFYQHLKTIGFQPATVIDVGVAWGTPPLYEAFPDAFFLLFEALPMFEPTLKNLMRKLRGEYHLKALSSYEGSKEIYVGKASIQRAGASLFHTRERKESDLVSVEVTRLDTFLSNRSIAGPVLMKIDAQGSDIDVLRGARRTLDQCEVIVAESSLFPAANPENQVHAIIAQMVEYGFVPYDFLSLRNRPYDNALGQLDIAFVKESGPLRKHSQWA